MKASLRKLGYVAISGTGQEIFLLALLLDYWVCFPAKMRQSYITKEKRSYNFGGAKYQAWFMNGFTTKLRALKVLTGTSSC